VRLLVAGGTGLLGRAVAAEARARGHDVRAPGSRELDLREPIPFLHADAVVNCAYVQRGPDLRAVTVEGAVALAGACAAAGARLVQLSTDLVFAGRSAPYTPADEPDPVDDYGRA
jgi:dTDP-4-dehydrorhamnose reductase